MSINPTSNPLYWEATYAIARRLIDVYPDVAVETVGVEQLHRWIVSLPEFADDPTLYDAQILSDVLREWFEEISSR
ncbi:MAG: Fe-S cluster assembly protein IscX [Chloroflexota bacterium]|nr:Fe-S cluster assembly protein IscX [Chloroflexota bacterium]